jgi:hypothetical protein
MCMYVCMYECGCVSQVLFVCKLNPVTRDEDLEVIFSRSIRRCVDLSGLLSQRVFS